MSVTLSAATSVDPGLRPAAEPGVYVRAALEAVEAAAVLIRAAFGGNFTVREKSDATPVTDVDEAAEAAVKTVLRRHFPQHAFFGEEQGFDASGAGETDKTDADFLWLIDPIDGTKAFVAGYPVFSTQLALMVGGEIIAGVSSAPCWNGGDGEVIWAEKGGGAWLSGRRLKMSQTSSVAQTTLSLGNTASLARSSAWARLGALVPRLRRIRGYGDFLHYHWLAGGHIDAVIESDVNILDVAACSLIVTEAGGRFTDLCGQSLSLDTRSVLAAPPQLHSNLLTELAYEPPA